MSVWLGLDSSTALEVTSAPSDGAYEEIYDFHNFGYVLDVKHRLQLRRIMLSSFFIWSYLTGRLSRIELALIVA